MPELSLWGSPFRTRDERFQDSKTPTALYDNYIKANPCVASVGIDNNEGMELAVTHLKNLGHKKIGYLSGALGSYIMQVRQKAFFNAMRQNGLRTDPSFFGSLTTSLNVCKSTYPAF